MPLQTMTNELQNSKPILAVADPNLFSWWRHQKTPK